MIIQGSNVPITLTLDTDVSTIPTLVATLWNDAQMVKRWDKADMTVDGNTISLPMSEDETAIIKAEHLTIEIKGLDSNSKTLFWDDAPVKVTRRKDSKIKLTE